MAFLLREINYDNWFDATAALTDPLPSDPLADLNTAGNALSVWLVDDEKSNLADIVIAIAACKGKVRNYDVALIEESRIAELGIKIEETSGHTPLHDTEDRHRDLVNLTATELIQIAEVIRNAEDHFEQFLDDYVRQGLADAVNSERLDAAELQPGVRKHLQTRSLI